MCNLSEADLVQQASDGAAAFLSASTPLEVSTIQAGSIGDQTGATTLTSLLPLPSINPGAANLPHDTPTWAARLHDCQVRHKQFETHSSFSKYNQHTLMFTKVCYQYSHVQHGIGYNTVMVWNPFLPVTYLLIANIGASLKYIRGETDNK